MDQRETYERVNPINGFNLWLILESSGALASSTLDSQDDLDERLHQRLGMATMTTRQPGKCSDPTEFFFKLQHSFFQASGPASHRRALWQLRWGRLHRMRKRNTPPRRSRRPLTPWRPPHQSFLTPRAEGHSCTTGCWCRRPPFKKQVGQTAEHCLSNQENVRNMNMSESEKVRIHFLSNLENIRKTSWKLENVRILETPKMSESSEIVRIHFCQIRHIC